jgi:predicted nucleic acid-binding protein
LLKLVFLESETAGLRRWLRDLRDETVASSELARVEVLLSCRRWHEQRLPDAQAVLDAVDVIDLTPAIVDAAARGPAVLGALDALHLATARSVERVIRAFVTYDKALAQAAQRAGFTVTAPR